MGITYNLTYAMTLVVLPFIRNRFGRRAFEPHIVMTLFALLFLAGMHPMCLGYFIVWFVLVVYHRVQSKDLQNHSQYQGYPWVGMKLPFTKTEEKAKHAEPLVCFIMALLVLEFSQELALFIGAAGFALIVKHGFDEAIDRRRLEAMRDAELVMQYYAQKFRERG